jgi:hypothetical protein
MGFLSNIPNLTYFRLCSVIPLVHPSTHGLASICIFRISETTHTHTYAHNNAELFAEKSTRRSKKSIVNVHDIHAFVDKTPPLIQRPTTVGGLDKRAADSYWKAYRPNKTDGITLWNILKYLLLCVFSPPLRGPCFWFDKAYLMVDVLSYAMYFRIN